MIVKSNKEVEALKHLKKKQLNPPQLIIVIFASLILTGTIGLVLPISSSTGHSIGLMNAIFTAISAVCVNGLTLINIGADLSTFGQIMIMILVQIGGLGFMSISVMIAIVLGKKIGLKERLMIQHTTQSNSAQGLVRLSIYIITIVLTFELCATIILTLHWQSTLGFERALFEAIFYSISAFNNAGFALNDVGLVAHVGDPFVTITLSLLIIAGGIGYIVIVDLIRKRKWKHLSLHSKIVISSSIIITLLTFIIFYLLESLNVNTFGSLTVGERIQAAWFQSVVPRSAGFNTVDISALLPATQFIMIILMFIGAASGGTGGGVKINTIVVLMLATLATFRGGGQVKAFNRGIPIDSILRALAVVISSLLCVLMVALLLTLTENLVEETFLEVLFEATSAFSTTGLSMGLTRDLTDPGKVIIAITMFIGRLGPLTLAYALAHRKSKSRFSYPEDSIMIG